MGGGDGAGESIMVKLVVSDLDGTLIDSSEQLTDTAREMARWLKDRNVLFTFATGRVQGMTERYAQDMQVSIPYVATNGAALIAPDGVLFRRKVPLKPLETMLRKADSMGMSIIYSEDGYEKVCRETPYILRQRAAFGRYNDVAPLTQADYDGKQMEKICVMDSDKTGDKINYVEDFIRRLGDQYSYTRYGDKAANPDIVLGANTRGALLELNQLARLRKLSRLMDEGVSFITLDGIIIGTDVRIGCDTTILPNTVILGNTTIGKGCTIGANSHIENCTIGDNVQLNNVQAYDSVVENNVKIGPFAQLRPGTTIREGVKIGDFVEIKNSDIGVNTAVAHLTYVGDSDVGRGVNFGCGCVTANYDGINKFRTKIGDHAFIGCNTNLIAPVEVGENASTAAGSTVTKNVPDNSLAVERGQMRVIENWGKNALRKKK